MVKIDIGDDVAVITLDKPDKRNAICPQMLNALLDALNRVCATEQVRVVVLTGSGSVFCAGADITEAYEDGINNAQQLLELKYQPIFQQIIQSNKLFIAALNGAAVGIGASLAMACDLLVMGESTSLFFPFSQLALVPDGGASWYLVRQIGAKRALQVFLEGQTLDAHTCLQWGLCNTVIADDAVAGTSQEWAQQLARRSPVANALTKKLIAVATEADLDHVYSLEADYQKRCEGTQDFWEAQRAFAEKRQPVFTGK